MISVYEMKKDKAALACKIFKAIREFEGKYESCRVYVTEVKLTKNKVVGYDQGDTTGVFVEVHV